MSRTVLCAADLAPAYDVVVVGAGPAGLSAATVAAAHGLAVLLADENEGPGGQIYGPSGERTPPIWRGWARTTPRA